MKITMKTQRIPALTYADLEVGEVARTVATRTVIVKTGEKESHTGHPLALAFDPALNRMSPYTLNDDTEVERLALDEVIFS